MDDTMELGIVVVSWNVRDLLAACLESVYADLARSGLAGEVWVVDNHSGDGSAAMVGARFPQAHLIANDRNLGFAAANNVALREMGAGDWAQGGRPPTADGRRSSGVFATLLLNPDTVVLPGALETLLEFMRCTPRAGVAGAGLLNPDGSPQECAFGFPGLWQAALDLFPPAGPWRRLARSRLNGRYPAHLFEQGEPFRIGHPLGAAFMARGEAIAQVGLLDEGYQMYCEEIDWAWRFRDAGWSTYCVPQARVIHYSGQSAAQARDSSYVQLWRSRKRLYEAHRSGLTARLVAGLVRLAMQRRARAVPPAERGPYLEVARLWRE